MQDIVEVLSDLKSAQNASWNGQWSLECQLEVCIGEYYLDGSPDDWQLVYYPVKEDELKILHLKKHKIIAALCETYGIAVVIQEYYERFIQDTKGYGFQYICCQSLWNKDFYCSNPDSLSKIYPNNILWINDDFLFDETIEFNYEAFEKIDSGTDYINPNHFSIMKLIKRL